MIVETGVAGPLRWAVMSVPLRGESVSGDLHVVATVGGIVLLAVIDGLGHGPEAAEAAREAARVLESVVTGAVGDAMLACHRALGRTRGAVMSIARVAPDGISWVGVGNVEAALVPGPSSASPRARLLLANGIVGHSLPTLRTTTARIGRGDLIVLGTDGLRAGFLDQLDVTAPPDRLVQRLHASYATGRDDTLALAARYDGEAA